MVVRGQNVDATISDPAENFGFRLKIEDLVPPMNGTFFGDQVLTNARVVLPGCVIEQGWVALAGGMIAEVGESRAPDRGEDCGGDLPMPGLVEPHTDHLEAH